MLTSLVLFFACSTPEAPKKEAPKKPSCELKVDGLPGTMWMHMKQQPVGPDKPNPMARVRFRDEAGALKADYTASSAGSVYKYDCTTAGGIATCVEADAHASAWCHAWAATHDGVCDPAGLAAATGIPQAEFDKVAETVNKELKALKKPDEIAQQRKMDNSPNNKIRGKFKVAVDPAKCTLTLQDKYQTMVDSKVNEFENVLGSAKFIKADADYTFDTCEDADSAWAPGPDDNHLAVQAAGTIKFSAILQKAQKGAAGCTYTADIYKDWVKTQSDVPATEDKKYGPRWDVSIPFTEEGKHVVYFDRNKTCGDKKEHIGMTCGLVRVGG